MKQLLTLVIFFILSLHTFAWTSSNEGICYNMDILCELSDSIAYNDTTGYYDVRCDIIILENDTLHLIAGDVVKFFVLHKGRLEKYSIKIFGCIIAEGTKEQKIYLGDPDCDFGIGERWAGMKFYNTSPNQESSLSHCNFIGAQDVESGDINIYCENSSPCFDHCTFSIMSSGSETGGGAAIYCTKQSFPVLRYCTFFDLRNCVAVICGKILSEGKYNQDTINYPSPHIYKCNIMPSVGGFWFFYCNHDKVVIHGGFLDNCYLGINTSIADTTTGIPVDTIGDGICNTSSANSSEPRFYKIDGVVNPAGEPIDTDAEYINNPDSQPEYFSLNVNSPNPFSTQTLIKYSIYKNNFPATLLVHDIQGRVIKTFFRDKKHLYGEYYTIWKGENDQGKKLPPGIYYVQLRSKESVQTIKSLYFN